jgi:hypothetical protein
MPGHARRTDDRVSGESHRPARPAMSARIRASQSAKMEPTVEYPLVVAQGLYAQGQLGRAWVDAEAALPEGWVIDGLRRLYDFGIDTGQFVARATRPPGDGESMPLRTGTGPTPVEALRALAASEEPHGA